MKKLMIAAAIVCAAALSQAATVSWTLTNVKEGGAAVSGVMYVFADSATARADVLALAGKGAAAFNAFFAEPLDNGAKWTVTDGTGTMAANYASKPTNAQMGVGDYVTENFYAVVFDTATITDDSKFYVTGLKEVTTADGSSNKVIGFGTQATASSAAGAWQAVAVPEPTSGLLLLLGVAGLALKRRRA